MYQQNSEKATGGGGGAPPSHYASVVFCRKSMSVNTVSRVLLIIMAHHDTINALQATGK